MSSKSSSKLNPIPPNPPRWEPSQDPASIVIPGLDLNASINDQIDQIDQLITLKLQNVDANFSRIQHLIAAKLLPAVKRYAVSTEPVREAAKFWTSFYEEAAQVRIPTYEDYSTINETKPLFEQEEPETTAIQRSTTPVNTPDYEQSLASTETSFLPAQAAFSSTPATATRHHPFNVQDSFASENTRETSSWTASIESPLVRLDREIHSLDQQDTLPSVEPPIKSSLQQYQARSQDLGQTEQLRVNKGKMREHPQPLRHNVLRQNMSSPRKTPMRSNVTAAAIDDFENSDDSLDELPHGMSPPVTMQFARAPRASIGLGLLPSLGRTPKKEAADRIRRDLLGDVERQSGNVFSSQGSYIAGYSRDGKRSESSMSTVPTPPSLSQYTRHAYPYGMDSSESAGFNASLDSMMRRVGLNVTNEATPSNVDLDLAHDAGRLPASITAQETRTPDQPRYDEHRLQDETEVGLPDPNDGSYSDSDSLDDEQHNTAHPSAAFLMASERQHGPDDSFGSSNNSSDSLNEDHTGEGIEPVHLFSHGVSEEDGDGFEDDSFDDVYDEQGVEEETVFGVPPAQRSQAQPQGRGQQLILLGEDLLQDTLGIGAHMAITGRVEESPTPFPGSRV